MMPQKMRSWSQRSTITAWAGPDYWLETQDNAGFTLCCHYTEFGRKEQSGQLAVYWGALISPTRRRLLPGVPGTPKWNSLVTWASGLVAQAASVFPILLALRLRLWS